MLPQSSSAIVLRKLAGRFEACWSSSGAVARPGVAASPVPSITTLAWALIVMLIPAVLTAVALLLMVQTSVVAGVLLATVPVAIPAEKIRDEIMSAFEQFKLANDKELAEIKAKGDASSETKALVATLNDTLSELQAKVTRLTVGAPAGAGDATQLDATTRAKLQAFFCPSEDERDQKATLKLAFNTRDIRAAQGTGTAAAGGAIVAPTFSNRLERALLFFSGMTQNAEIMTTDTGADLPWPTVNDTAQKGARLAENTAVPAQDVAFSSVTLKAWTYTSKLILVPWQLMQDSAFALEEMIADIAGERLGRILNEEFTTGAGTTLPFGAVTTSTLGKTGTAGQTTSVIYDDLVDLIHSVDIAYRMNSKFMLSDASLKVVRKLKDTQGRPLWEPSLQAGTPDTLLGYPIVINNDVPAMAASAKSILFGDFSKYKIRRVKEISLVRMNERYADALQTGFFAYARFDGNLINAGTNPLKHYAHPAA